MSVVEKAARAMARRNYPGASEADIDVMWDGWRHDALAALKALREPTEEMLDASWHAAGESKEMRPRTHAHYKRHWQAMIDTALAGEGKDR